MYYNPDTQAPFSLHELKAAHEGVSFPRTGPDDAWLAEHGYAYLVDGEHLTPNPNQVEEQDGYERVDDLHYRLKYVLRDKTPEEIEAETRQGIMSQIHALEAQQTPRRIREAAIGIQDSIDFLADLENQISLLRAQLPSEE